MVEKGKEGVEVVKGGHEVDSRWLLFEHGLEKVVEERKRRKVGRSRSTAEGGMGAWKWESVVWSSMGGWRSGILI